MIRGNREHSGRNHPPRQRGNEESNGIPLGQNRRLAHVFRILSDPSVAKIIQTLRHGGMSLWSLAFELDMKPIVVLRHILSLRRVELVLSRRRGDAVLHSLANPELGEVLDLIHTMSARELQRLRILPVSWQQQPINSLPPRSSRMPGGVSDDAGAATQRERARVQSRHLAGPRRFRHAFPGLRNCRARRKEDS